MLDEVGPAHKKVFFVVLKLGAGLGEPYEETYNGRGSSIKKAQHAAAENALKATKFKMPVARHKKKTSISSDTNPASTTTTTAAAAATATSGGPFNSMPITADLAKRLYNTATDKSPKTNRMIF